MPGRHLRRKMYEVVHNLENMEVTISLKEYPTQNIAGGCVRIRIYGSTLFAKAPTLPYPLNQKTTFIENSQKVMSVYALLFWQTAYMSAMFS